MAKEFDEITLKSMITHGYSLEDRTLFVSAKKLRPGNLLILDIEQPMVLQFENYYWLDNKENHSITFEEATDELNRLFDQAVNRAFSKDEEYGYEHLVALSGGLDSRMVNYAANKLGYSKNITNITFSQTGALDHLNPQKISSELSHRWLFKSFDDARFMTEYSKTIDYIIPMNILGYLHANSMMKLLNKNSFGILHTGILGDIVVGTYSSEDFHREWRILDGAKSSIKVRLLTEIDINFNYQNEEIFKFYNSGLNGVRAFEEVLQSEIEQYSPFLDIDFLNYSIKLPLSFRRHHRLYFNWINSYYPSAAKFKWTRDLSNINSLHLKIFGRNIPISQLPKRIVNKIKQNLGFTIESKSGMNPLDLYSKIPYIKDFLANEIISLSIIATLLNGVNYNDIITYDKFNLITLQSLIKNSNDFEIE